MENGWWGSKSVKEVICLEVDVEVMMVVRVVVGKMERVDRFMGYFFEEEIIGFFNRFNVVCEENFYIGGSIL